LGRSHELREDLYEAVSHSFLEWYLYEFPIGPAQKTPMMIYLSLNLCPDKDYEILERSLYNRWSIYEIVEKKSDFVIFKDLLFGVKRRAYYFTELTPFRSWSVQVGQVIQARFFQFLRSEQYFFNHVWIHPKGEDELVRTACQEQKMDWGWHGEFLLASFEAVVQTMRLQDQLAVTQGQNPMYQELGKKYA